MLRILTTLLLIGTGLVAIADEPVTEHLQRGEFGAAFDRAMQLPTDARDAALADIVLAQRGFANPGSASSTLREIESSEARSQATRSVPAISSSSATNRGTGAAGGSSFADFQSLIDLIQNTVDPESWDALGGQGTMQEYPQGVYVDPNGTLQTCETLAATDSINNLATLLARPRSAQLQSALDISSEPRDWKSASNLRCVSLRRLRDAWADAIMHGGVPGEALSHLAGLSTIQYVVVQENDILLLGKTAGTELHQGWFRDHDTGLAAIRLDILATTILAARQQTPFGCTIDPTTEGLKAAAATAAKVASRELPIGKAADAMIDAIGMQNIEVFGTPADSPLALMMVEADRHMKQLALGVHPMPGETSNYLEIVDEYIAQGVPNDLLLRLWFTASARSVRTDNDRIVFEMTGVPVKLSGQNERAVADGARGNLTTDFRSEAFVKRFNQNWSDIRATYPIYAGLESVFQASSAAALAHQFAKSPHQQALLDSLASMASSSSRYTRVPQQVETIAVLHNIRHRSQRHHIVMASGGVAVNPRLTLARTFHAYPSLSSMTRADEDRPKLIHRWWWDVR
ncbi:hypothetical protein Pla22_20640 [Rubripirellula amarantea]|uniref:DUF1598 domain-containing protein n=1 Tax=Rubripirellula amarantea TaxID=2527999 RepID=A0A5C5WUK1_9BACT|nr:DUF1598 domain-containing protein [Rubripirellula amarantea]TWT54417.1 hypothetical protein Pla22_20640 [Rubripirellula amarantea]